MEVSTSILENQHFIDINEGTTLKKDRSARYLGCSAHVLLVLIVLVKFALISAWLVREYGTFDFRCSMISDDFNYESAMLVAKRGNQAAVNANRQKRSTNKKDLLDPRFRNRKRPMIGGTRRLLSTMVTHTNTQVLQGENAAEVRMKTIRNRVEKVKDQTGKDRGQKTIQGPPMIYISPILNGKYEETEITAKKPEKGLHKKKKKGKGRKNNKNLATTPAPSTKKPSKKTKKRKGKGKKRKKNKNRKKGRTEQTKAPRHLFAAPVAATTPSVPGSSFLHGAIDPSHASFTNKGEIRGYPMQRASKKPKPKLQLSEETRLMWKMNEANFTTHKMNLKTTEITREWHEKSSLPSIVPSRVNPQPERPTYQTTTTSTEAPVLPDFYSTKVTTWSKKPKPLRKKEGVPKVESTTILKDTKNEQPVAIYYETIKQAAPPKIKDPNTERGYEEVTGMPPTQVETTTKSRLIKHGFDRGLDTAIENGILDYPIRPTTQVTVNSEVNPYRFQDELTSFTSSSLCVARLLFNIWCLCQIFSSIPFSLGICFARRNFFVAHLVLDILFLVIASIFSVTTVVFSIILYLFVGEMRRSTLLHWLLFAILLDVILVLYSAAVVISLRSCEQVVQYRKHRIKTNQAEAV